MYVEDRYLLHLYHKLPIYASKGSGVYLFDRNGKRYLDFMSAYGVALLGHCHPNVVRAITTQARKLISAHGSVYNEAREVFLERLSKIAPANLERFYICNSGAEAVEAALKFARRSTGRKGFISFKGGYHGKTFGALSVTANERYRDVFEPLIGPVHFGVYGDALSLDSLPFGESAAAVVEPVQGEAGIKIPGEDFMKELEKRCKENGCLLIVDEIQSGLGRTGMMWAHERFKIRPDMITVAKGLAGGVPMGVTMVDEEVASKIQLGDHTTTFGGNPLACAAASAVIETIENMELVKNATFMGKRLAEGLMEFVRYRIVREVRTIGLMAAIELRIRFNPILESALKGGLITLYSGRNTVRMLPPLIVNDADIEKAVQILRNSIETAEKVAVTGQNAD